MGTLINVALILAGGIIGLLFGKWIKSEVQDTLMTANGVAVLFLSIGGVMSRMLSANESGISQNGIMMMIVSLSAGTLIGELLHIQTGIEKLGDWLKRKTGSQKDSSFLNAFISATCTVCIGAMAVVGSIQDGVSGDFTTLLAKGILDAVIIMIMTASLGKGCIFSALPVAIFQGSITLIAHFAGSFMTENALAHLSYVGNILIFCVGINLVWKKEIRVANMLPAIVIAALWP
ncbi:MAG TPA: DUF554 domain-containing protein [Treponema sp.]|jgi:uncharacterized membrane protein YqgA involved in biofilm formation|nr:DUF554 domain-containing protein [Treponema sp.]HBB42704.1 DUF554 domain-containing protein [Treponema sp.]HCA20225.1 DUF554 domain-containing protein [Treponema sp.]